jgi:hypothetical protein
MTGHGILLVGHKLGRGHSTALDTLLLPGGSPATGKVARALRARYSPSGITFSTRTVVTPPLV